MFVTGCQTAENVVADMAVVLRQKQRSCPSLARQQHVMGYVRPLLLGDLRARLAPQLTFFCMPLRMCLAPRDICRRTGLLSCFEGCIAFT